MSISPRWFPSSRIRNNMWAVTSMKSIFSARKTILKLHCKGIFNTRWRQKVSFLKFLWVFVFTNFIRRLFTTHNKTAQFTVYIELRLLNIFHLIEFFRNFLPSKPSYLIIEAYRLRKNFQSTALSLIWPVNKIADKITLVHDRSRMSRMVKDDPSEQ